MASLGIVFVNRRRKKLLYLITIPTGVSKLCTILRRKYCTLYNCGLCSVYYCTASDWVITGQNNHPLHLQPVLFDSLRPLNKLLCLEKKILEPPNVGLHDAQAVLLSTHPCAV